MAFGLQDGGFVLKRLVDVRDSLVSRIEGYLGGPIDTSGNSPLGMLVGITSQGMAVVWSELSKVSDNMDPATASGDNLIDWGRRMNMYPKPAQPFATAEVQVKVDSGSITLADGTEITIDGVAFKLDGAITVNNTSYQPAGVWIAQEAGRIELGTDSGNINGVDWQFAGGVGGRNAESEDEFRIRVVERESDTGCATDVAMAQALTNMPFLIDAIVVSNRTMGTVDGMPPKSFEAIIAPVGALTSAQEMLVLDTLFETQPAGIESHAQGAHISHAYAGSIPVTVQATIATETAVDVLVEVDGTYNTQAVNDGVTSAFGVKRIGETVYASSLYCGVQGLATVVNIEVNGSNLVQGSSRVRYTLGNITVQHV